MHKIIDYTQKCSTHVWFIRILIQSNCLVDYFSKIFQDFPIFFNILPLQFKQMRGRANCKIFSVCKKTFWSSFQCLLFLHQFGFLALGGPFVFSFLWTFCGWRLIFSFDCLNFNLLECRANGRKRIGDGGGGGDGMWCAWVFLDSLELERIWIDKRVSIRGQKLFARCQMPSEMKIWRWFFFSFSSMLGRHLWIGDGKVDKSILKCRNGFLNPLNRLDR